MVKFKVSREEREEEAEEEEEAVEPEKVVWKEMQ